VATVFYIFTFSWLGIAPIVQLATNSAAWGDTAVLSDPARVSVALWMNAVATAAFFIGAEAARSRENKQEIFRNTAALNRKPVFAFIVAGALALTPYAISANGGLGPLFSSRGELGDQLASAGLSMEDVGGPHYALIHILPGALGIAISLLSIHSIRRAWRGFRNVGRWPLVGFLLGVIILVIFANPLANSRFIAASAFGSIVLSIFRPRSRRSANIFAALVLLVTLLIYPLANAFRSSKATVETGRDAFTGPDFDGFQQVLNTMEYVNDFGHTLGIHVLSGLGFFIPRSIWAEKAEPSSSLVASHAGYTWTNLSMPIHAEFFLEFGWLGMLLAMGLLGYGVGRMDSAWLLQPETKLALLAPYVAPAMLGLIRGPIGGGAPVWGAVLLLLLLGIRSASQADTARILSIESTNKRYRNKSRVVRNVPQNFSKYPRLTRTRP
jgi:hypothetical protein